MTKNRISNMETKILNFYKKMKLNRKKQISFSKLYSEFHKTDKKISDISLICKKECSSFCDSHSIPKFVLNSIATDGKLLTGNSFMSKPIGKPTGKGNTFVFSCICQDCDSKYFQDYEHIEKITKSVTNVSLNEISMKNYLRYAYKQYRCAQFYKKILDEIYLKPEERYFFENQSFLLEKDVDETITKVIKYSKKKEDRNFYLIDEINLNYKSQIAYQGFITLVWGFDKLVNNIFNYDDSYQMQQLGVCVFPFNTETKILLFCEEGSTRLRDFYKKYRKLSLSEKLYVINYMILLYEEDWAIGANFDAKKLNKETLLLINTSSIIERMTDSIPTSPTASPNVSMDLLKDAYELKTCGTIYNFLTADNN